MLPHSKATWQSVWQECGCHHSCRMEFVSGSYIYILLGMLAHRSVAAADMEGNDRLRASVRLRAHWPACKQALLGLLDQVGLRCALGSCDLHPKPWPVCSFLCR